MTGANNLYMFITILPILVKKMKFYNVFYYNIL